MSGALEWREGATSGMSRVVQWTVLVTFGLCASGGAYVVAFIRDWENRFVSAKVFDARIHVVESQIQIVEGRIQTVAEKVSDVREEVREIRRTVNAIPTLSARLEAMQREMDRHRER